NAFRKGDIAVTIGTSGAIRTVIPKPHTDPKGRIFCYALTEDHWVIGGPVNNGGIVFRWIRDELAASEVETAKRLGIEAYDVLTRIAEKVEPGANGLLFHPYLAGERAPLWNASSRGTFPCQIRMEQQPICPIRIWQVNVPRYGMHPHADHL